MDDFANIARPFKQFPLFDVVNRLCFENEQFVLVPKWWQFLKRLSAHDFGAISKYVVTLVINQWQYVNPAKCVFSLVSPRNTPQKSNL